MIVQRGADDRDGRGLRDRLHVPAGQENEHLRAIATVEFEHRARRSLLHGQIIEECLRRPVHHEKRLLAPAHSRLEIFGNVHDSDRVAPLHQLLGFRETRLVGQYPDLRRGVEQSRVLAAQRAVRAVDHRYGGVADQVRLVHIVIQQAVQKNAAHQHEQHGIARRDGAELVGRDGGDIPELT